jgi:hypothetical protein
LSALIALLFLQLDKTCAPSRSQAHERVGKWRTFIFAMLAYADARSAQIKIAEARDCYGGVTWRRANSSKGFYAAEPEGYDP